MATSESGPLEFDTLRTSCWDRAIHAFGTGYIFERRASIKKSSLQRLTYSGLIGPVIVGVLALSYGAGFKALPIIIVIVSAVGVGQICVSLWSIINNWVDAYSYATRSAAANNRLAGQFRQLAQNPPTKVEDFRRRLEILVTEDDGRREQDVQQDITDAEKRRGLRAALREFRRPCVECKAVPTSVNNPTQCPVCGNY